MRTRSQSGDGNEGGFPGWGIAALPVGILWGAALGAFVGMLLGNVAIGAAVGAGLGVGIGMTVFAAAVVSMSAKSPK